jgi:hypothetical protein
VSLLERLRRGHLDDREFARLWTTGGGHRHLEGCATCRARFEDFDRWIMGIGVEVRAEADRAMTAERLSAQQIQIARRLEALERPARVIAFPKAARAVISGNSHARRWVTVAAAAGLIAGIGLGQIVDLHRGIETAAGPASASHIVATDTTARRDVGRTAAANVADVDMLLNPDSWTQPHVNALGALEDLTPHARELTDRPR